MKKLIITMIFGLGFLCINAQTAEVTSIQKLAGPRIGITFLMPGSSADFVNEGFDSDWDGSSGLATIAQYGWQFETRFAEGGDIMGIVEWVILTGGMEQGLFLPSFSSLVGLRTSNGYEFAIGPNLSLSGMGMVFTTGYNFRSGDLNLPVNIAFVPGKNGAWGGDDPTGARVSIMIGFNFGK